MFINMFDFAKHVDCHEIHNINYMSLICSFVIYYKKIEIDQYIIEIVNCFEICDDNVGF